MAKLYRWSSDLCYKEESDVPALESSESCNFVSASRKQASIKLHLSHPCIVYLFKENKTRILSSSVKHPFSISGWSEECLVNRDWETKRMLSRWIKSSFFACPSRLLYSYGCIFSTYQTILAFDQRSSSSGSFSGSSLLGRSSLLGLALTTLCFAAFLVFHDYRRSSSTCGKSAPIPLYAWIPILSRSMGMPYLFVLEIREDLPSLLHFKIRKRKQHWQSQTHLLELTYKGVMRTRRAAEILRGFDYRSYFGNTGHSLPNKIENDPICSPIQTWNVFDCLSHGGAKPLFEQGASSATDEPVYDRPSFLAI